MSEKIFADDDDAQYCTCDSETHDLHICPLKEARGEENQYCSCCPFCTDQCRDDV